MTSRKEDDTMPGEFHELEGRLRAAMAQEARQVQPHDRLEEIRARVASAPRGRGVPRWLAPLGTAAAVLLVAGAAWLGLRPATQTPPVGAPTSTTAPTSTPATSAPTTGGASNPSTGAATAPTTGAATVPPTRPTGPPTTGTGTGGPPSSAPGTPTPPTAPPPSGPAPTTPPAAVVPPTVAGAVPVYFVGPVQSQWLLHREFLGAQLPAGADAAARATAALNLALNARPYSTTDGYLQAWPTGTKAGAVKVSDTGIAVQLSSAGTRGLSPAQQQAAVASLVYSATAAAGASVPVTFSIADGSTQLFETAPTTQTYQRVARATEFTVLAPIWVDNPSRGQVLPAGRPVTVSGQACVFEAALQWQLRQGTALVRNGTTTASSGCPSQGIYAFDLGGLPAGDYSVRVFALSAKDGSVAAEKSVAFSVR